MKRPDANWHAQDSVVIMGSNNGVVQNAGQGSTAINRQSDVGFQATEPPRQPGVQDLVARIRVLLDASAPSARDAGDYEKALETIEADAASPARDRSSITRALRLLTGAAGMVTGWADAVTALQRAIGRL